MINKALDKFMSAYPHEGLTFDDVSLITMYADFLPAESDTKTLFSRNIELNTPFVSAAMDTVTESEMAISMARLGSIGVIHKNLSIEEQAEEVKRVKHYLNGLIKNPVTFHPDHTVSYMLKEKENKKYSFTGFPIIDDDKHIVGIISRRDIKFVTNNNVKLRDVMVKNVITAPEGTPLTRL